MTKNDIIKNLSARTGLDSKKCERVLDALADEIKASLVKGDKVTLKNFMTFEITQRSERQGRNPQTGETVFYPSVKSVKCKVCQAFKDAINGK